MNSRILGEFASALLAGTIKIIDITAPLGPDTPVKALPPEIGKSTPAVKIHKISRYDSNGPNWAWNWLELGEHTGTHFDAPSHWISGKDHTDNTTDRIPVKNFVAPACVIDRSKEATANADYLLTVESIKEWEFEHGQIDAGSWVLLRTDWCKRNGSAQAFLNNDDSGSHYPGPTAAAIEYLLSKGIVGWGSDTISTDAGSGGRMTPPFPAHNLIHKANRYGLASLCHLDQLPPKGAVIIAAPLKIVNGTGSPVRAIALVGLLSARSHRVITADLTDILFQPVRVQTDTVAMILPFSTDNPDFFQAVEGPLSEAFVAQFVAKGVAIVVSL